MSNEAFTLRTRRLRPTATSRSVVEPSPVDPAADCVRAADGAGSGLTACRGLTSEGAVAAAFDTGLATDIPATLELIRGARDAIFATYGPCAAASMPIIANAVRARVELAPWPLDVKRRILSELASLA